MSDIFLPEQSAETNETGSTVRRFLARRGLLMMKEHREIAKIKCNYSHKITVTTIIISIANTANRDASYGIAFEQIGEEGRSEASAFLDFDEVDELVGALAFVGTIANQMQHERRDYTEVTYMTKDGMKFGFYQQSGQQQAFIDVGSGGNSVFLDVPNLQSVKQAIESAAAHLVSRGAEA